MTAKSSPRAKSSSNGAADVSMRPAPFRFASDREWIACPVEGLEGFEIEVRTDITVGEQRAFIKGFDRITNVLAQKWRDTPEAERDFAESPQMHQRALVAPYVLDWNAEGIDAESGEWAPLPAPATAGPAVFDCITDAALDWIFDVILVGYYGSGKAKRPEPPSAPTGDTSGPVSLATSDPQASPSRVRTN